mmetsp:Transcript_43392/g.105828  ORF Transcript_43392/g.105828 Transcript_43392/m.105828 type:complete len:237 (+) Transcript_43392:1012-1722(+)
MRQQHPCHPELGGDAHRARGGRFPCGGARGQYHAHRPQPPQLPVGGRRRHGARRDARLQLSPSRPLPHQHAVRRRRRHGRRLLPPPQQGVDGGVDGSQCRHRRRAHRPRGGAARDPPLLYLQAARVNPHEGLGGHLRGPPGGGGAGRVEPGDCALVPGGVEGGAAGVCDGDAPEAGRGLAGFGPQRQPALGGGGAVLGEAGGLRGRVAVAAGASAQRGRSRCGRRSPSVRFGNHVV